MSEHICMVVNSICISNHLSIQTWPLNPQVICITNARLLACDVDENVLGLDEKGITVMCSWSLNQSVHRINCLCMKYVHSPEAHITNDLLKCQFPFYSARQHTWSNQLRSYHFCPYTTLVLTCIMFHRLQTEKETAFRTYAQTQVDDTLRATCTDHIPSCWFFVNECCTTLHDRKSLCDMLCSL